MCVSALQDAIVRALKIILHLNLFFCSVLILALFFNQRGLRVLEVEDWTPRTGGEIRKQVIQRALLLIRSVETKKKKSDRLLFQELATKYFKGVGFWSIASRARFTLPITPLYLVTKYEHKGLVKSFCCIY